RTKRKGDADARATQKVSSERREEHERVLEIGPGVSRLITASGGSDNVFTRGNKELRGEKRREGREIELERANREQGEAGNGRGWKEKRPFLRIPKARRRDATTRL
ncbi:hypothetical protein X777_13685, partial [Ooceraea biroi]